MHQAPQQQRHDHEDRQHEVEERDVVREIERRDAESRRQPRDLEQAVLAAGDACALMAMNQKTWPKAMVISA